MEKLVAAFNPATLPGLMCRSMLSVDWQGRLYDCDFNQMLDLEIAPRSSTPRGESRPRAPRIQDLDDQTLADLARRRIIFGKHCFGCTAGAGSSCSGSLS